MTEESGDFQQIHEVNTSSANVTESTGYLDTAESISIPSNYSNRSDSDSDSEEDEQGLVNESQSLNSRLAEWITTENVPRYASDKLLQILTECGVGGLPKSSKTLLKTGQGKITPSIVTPGEYFHYGIQTYLHKCDILKYSHNVIIDLATDGLPLFKGASKIKLRPILGSFPNTKNIQPFLIGAYVGKKDPTSSDIFFNELCQEICSIKTAGGVLVKSCSIRKPLHIRLFTCDAPAGAFVCNVKSHALISGCSKCTQKGRKSNSKSGVVLTPFLSCVQTVHLNAGNIQNITRQHTFEHLQH